jgi:hypothetical protein
VEHESVVIILSAGGARLESDALAEMTGAMVIWVRVEREREAACLAARVRHEDTPEDFRKRARRWGAARGWAVTVARGHESY